MDPPRTSQSSFPADLFRVKHDSGPGPGPPDHRRLLRRIFGIERRLKGYVPRVPIAPEKPDQADEILAAVIARHRPGDKVGLRDIVAVAGVPQATAFLVRRWARHEGLWPYRTGQPRAADWSGFDDDGEGGEPCP